MDKATEERVNKPIPFQEFPKMKHHPDGRQATVNSEREESELGGEWCKTPTEALKVRANRDEADAKRLAAQIAEANADAGKDKGKGGKDKDKG